MRRCKWIDPEYKQSHSMIEQKRRVSEQTTKLACQPCDADCSRRSNRLRAWIDQVDRLIYFEGRSSQDQDDLQGTAGGLGVEHVEKPIEGISLTERWDERIKETSTKVNDRSTSTKVAFG